MGRFWRWLKRIFLLKARSHPRFPATEGAFVVIGPNTAEGRKIQILDISRGGLAFIYAGSPEDLEKEGTLGLMADGNLYLDQIEYETVWDDSLPEMEEDIRRYRRQGVRFKWLGIVDQRQLKAFIHDNAIPEKEDPEESEKKE
jgi:hypothetical protein